MGVSSAGTWNVTSGLASVSAVHLDGQHVSDISVAPGSTINIKLKYAVAQNTGCPGCDEEVQIGFANQNPDQCIGTDGFLGQGNQRPTLASGSSRRQLQGDSTDDSGILFPGLCL